LIAVVHLDERLGDTVFAHVKSGSPAGVALWVAANRPRHGLAGAKSPDLRPGFRFIFVVELIGGGRQRARGTPVMERFTVSLDGELLARFDAYARRRGYGNRSEAVRDILRERLAGESLAGDDGGRCVACLSYVFDHEERELGRRLTRTQHAHQALTLATLHVHLDDQACMEVTVLQGGTLAVRQLADTITAETGVRHGHLHAIPLADGSRTSAHHHSNHHHDGDDCDGDGHRHHSADPV